MKICPDLNEEETQKLDASKKILKETIDGFSL